jgi:hypothetical protein
MGYMRRKMIICRGVARSNNIILDHPVRESTGKKRMG